MGNKFLLSRVRPRCVYRLMNSDYEYRNRFNQISFFREIFEGFWGDRFSQMESLCGSYMTEIIQKYFF